MDGLVLYRKHRSPSIALPVDTARAALVIFVETGVGLVLCPRRVAQIVPAIIVVVPIFVIDLDRGRFSRHPNPDQHVNRILTISEIQVERRGTTVALYVESGLIATL